MGGLWEIILMQEKKKQLQTILWDSIIVWKIQETYKRGNEVHLIKEGYIGLAYK